MNDPILDPKHVVRSHNFTVTAVVCADGSTGLCGVATKVLPKGVELVGNGTCPHPLDVNLSGPYAVASELLEALMDAKRWIETLPEDIVGGSIMPEKLGTVIAKAKGQ